MRARKERGGALTSKYDMTASYELNLAYEIIALLKTNRNVQSIENERRRTRTKEIAKTLSR